MNQERNLVTLRRVREIIPIEGADKIELVKVGGWQCIVSKGKFEVGDVGMFFEIDSLLPMTPVFEFLKPRGTKKMFVDGREFEGYRLRTIKLKGQFSQGLLLQPEEIFDPIIWSEEALEGGYDYTFDAGVVEYEPPIPAELSGQAKGNFPSFIPKTDQERVQNLTKQLDLWAGEMFEITEKLDGSSMTIYLKDGEFGVCGRSWELKETEGNSLWKVTRLLNLERKLRRISRNLALQGELIGHGIQGNPYKIVGQSYRIYDIYDIDAARYLLPAERRNVMHQMAEQGEATEYLHVPILEPEYILTTDVEALLTKADGGSFIGDCGREGIVLKSCKDPRVSFKAISNEFLVKED